MVSITNDCLDILPVCGIRDFVSSLLCAWRNAVWIFAQLTIGAIRQIGSAIVIAIFILLGTSLPEIFVKYFRLAEPWFLTPYPRYATMAACALILILLSVWERLFASPLEKARLQLVREALDFLENHKDTKHLKWVKNNLAGFASPTSRAS